MAVTLVEEELARGKNVMGKECHVQACNCATALASGTSGSLERRDGDNLEAMQSFRTMLGLPLQVRACYDLLLR